MMSLMEFMKFGLSGWNWVGVLAFVFFVTHITIIGVTVFLHRCQSHRALKLNFFVSHFFRFWLWLTTGMVTKEWVAIHRKHHAKCETKNDPHSPKIKGINEVLWRGTELYRSSSNDSDLIQKYGHGTPDDWLEKNLYSKFSWQGVAIMLILDFIFFGVIGVGIWAIQMMWIPFFAAGVINGIGHYVGYRSFKTPDESRNIFPLGILIGGEELHNNHHSFATSPRLSSKWYEFDIGWFYIKILMFFGLAETRSIPKGARLNPKKSSIDEDTIAAFLASKYELLQKLHRLTLHATVSQIKTSHTTNGMVEKLKNDFENIWSEKIYSVEQAVNALQQWCTEAEKSGVVTIEEFARKLRMLTLSDSRVSF
jgi:stearoyl-CoA desaturase (delta-9 desaturase)